MSKGLYKLMTSALVWFAYIIWLTYFGSTSLSFGSVICYLFLLSFMVFVFRKDLLNGFKEFKKNKKKAIITILVLFLLVWVVMLLSNVLKSFIQNAFNLQFEDDNASKSIYSLLSNGLFGKIYVIFITIIFYPVVEELVFRKSLYDVIKNPICFVIVSSLVSWTFQVIFGNPQLIEFIFSLYIFFLSMFMSIILVKKKNILYAIIPRVLYNVIICVIRIITL